MPFATELTRRLGIRGWSPFHIRGRLFIDFYSSARRSRRHDARRNRRPRFSRLQRRRSRYHHRSHLPHARRPAQRNPALPNPH